MINLVVYNIDKQCFFPKNSEQANSLVMKNWSFIKDNVIMVILVENDNSSYYHFSFCRKLITEN